MSEQSSPPLPSALQPHPILGVVLGNYPSDRLPPLIVSGIAIGGGGLLVSFVIGTIPADWSPALAMLIMAIITGIVGWYLLHRWNREIILYEYGFIYREGSKFIDFVYNEIDSLRLRAERISYFGGLLKRSVTRVTVTTIRGEQFLITNLYRRAAELGARLQERVYRELRPQIARALVKGDAIRFSDTLRLSERGLHESGRDLTWDVYGGYRIGARQLALLDHQGSVWYADVLWEYDNLPILIDLLKSQINNAALNA